METKYRIITITGGDCAGKETQTKLLQKALTPSKRMSAPDYNHWAGEIIARILHEENFCIGRKAVRWYKQDKHPQILQLLHNINTWDKQETIRETLKTHHLVMDRYIEDAYAFGTMDGCSLDFILGLNRHFIPSDVVILLLGQGYPRSGESQDINERDSMFQQNVRHTFWSLMNFFPNWRAIDIQPYRKLPRDQSIHMTHKSVCKWASQGIGQVITPLGLDEVKDYVDTWERQRIEALRSPSAT